jgi:hypothetical protein
MLYGLSRKIVWLPESAPCLATPILGSGLAAAAEACVRCCYTSHDSTALHTSSFRSSQNRYATCLQSHTHHFNFQVRVARYGARRPLLFVHVDGTRSADSLGLGLGLGLCPSHCLPGAWTRCNVMYHCLPTRTLHTRKRIRPGVRRRVTETRLCIVRAASNHELVQAM